MKIKKLLLSFLTLLAVPCILTSCSTSSQKTESSSDSTQTTSVKSEDINYEDTVFMNTIYDEDADGIFENYEHRFIIKEESYKLSCTACYQAEGGKEYAKLYCDWSIEKLLSLDLEENYEKYIVFKKEDEKTYQLTDEQREVMTSECLAKIETLIYDNPKLVPICMYITLKQHIKNLNITKICFINY